MADYPWRLNLEKVKPCIFRAPTKEAALEKFIQYIKQPGRVHIEPDRQPIELKEPGTS
jgi:hypothetical protein